MTNSAGDTGVKPEVPVTSRGILLIMEQVRGESQYVQMRNFGE